MGHSSHATDQYRNAKQWRRSRHRGRTRLIAAATDNLIRAIDVETGATLWQDLLPAGGQANPMVYEFGGRHLVIMAGGHHFMGTPPEITSSLTRCRYAKGAALPCLVSIV